MGFKLKILTSNWFYKLLFVFFLYFLFKSFFLPIYQPVALKNHQTLQGIPKVVANQIPDSEHPSHTAEWLQDYLKQDIPALKVQVQSTKDGRIVLYPEDKLERLTNGKGEIKEKDIQDLKCLTYKVDEEESDYRILTLNDALKIINGQKPLVVEVIDQQWSYGKSTKFLASAIKQYTAYDSVVVSSLNPIILLQIRDFDPKVKLQYNFITQNHKNFLGLNQEFGPINWIFQWRWLQKQFIRYLQPELIGPHYSVEKYIIDELNEKQYPLMVWTLNQSQSPKPYFEDGVRGYETTKINETSKTVLNWYPDTADKLINALEFSQKQNMKLWVTHSADRLNQSPVEGKEFLIVHLNRLKKVDFDVEHKRLIVRGGNTFQEAQLYLTQFGRALPLYPFDSKLSISQALEHNVFGFNSKGFIFDYVHSVKILLADGTIKNCSLNENPDLFKQIPNSLGLLGVILEIQLETMENFIYEPFELSSLADQENIKFSWRQDITMPQTLKDFPKINYKYAAPLAINYVDIKYYWPYAANKEQSQYYPDTKNWSYKWANKVVHFFEQFSLSLNDIGYRKNKFIPTFHSTDEIRSLIYYLPKEGVDSGFEILNSGLKKFSTLNLISVVGVDLEATQSQYLKLPDSKGYAILFTLKFSKDTKGQAEFEKFTSLVNDQLLKVNQASFDLQNLVYTDEQLEKAYPNLPVFLNLRNKLDPKDHLWNTYRTRIQ